MHAYWQQRKISLAIILLALKMAVNSILGGFMAHKCPSLETMSNLHNIACNKSDTIAKMLETYSRNVTFRPHLVGARLATLQAIQERRKVLIGPANA
jgi:hypothetical protein